MEFQAACHQAVQVDVDDVLEALHFEFASAVQHDALRQYEHVELRKRRLERLDGLEIARVHLRVMQPGEIRAVIRTVIG